MPESTPTPAPTAAPAAPPEAAAANDVNTPPASASGPTPPLSIYDSGLLLAQAMRSLHPAPAAHPSEQQILYADRVLQTVIAYVDQVDRAHSTLPQYSWRTIAAEKLQKTGWGTQVFTLAKPLEQVTALALYAHHSDVEVKYLAAIDANGTKWEFNDLISILADQPRPEICFLPLPTRLREIRVVSRHADASPKNRARLFIDVGVCSIPESAKVAIYHLKLARANLRQRRLDEAQTHLHQGYQFLQEYQKSRNF